MPEKAGIMRQIVPSGAIFNNVYTIQQQKNYKAKRKQETERKRD